MSYVLLLISVPGVTVDQLRRDVRDLDSTTDEVSIDADKVTAKDVLQHMLNGDIGYTFATMSDAMWNDVPEKRRPHQ